MKIEIFKNSWCHQLYEFGCLSNPSRAKRSDSVSVWVFAHRITLSAFFVAYASFLRLLGLFLTVLLLEVPAGVLTLVSNLVTIPLGLGISVLYPEKKFLCIPFETERLGKKRNLAWIVVPLWVFLVNIWFWLYGNMEHIGPVIVWISSMIVLICYGHAVRIARMGEIVVTFVDSPVETKTTVA